MLLSTLSLEVRRWPAWLCQPVFWPPPGQTEKRAAQRVEAAQKLKVLSMSDTALKTSLTLDAAAGQYYEELDKIN